MKIDLIQRQLKPCPEPGAPGFDTEPQQKRIVSEYRTEQFQHQFEVERIEWTDQGNIADQHAFSEYTVSRDPQRPQRNKVLRTEYVLLEAEFDFELEKKRGTPHYNYVDLAYFSNLTPKGRFKFSDYGYNRLEATTGMYVERNLTPEVKKMIEMEFPDYNTQLKIYIHSELPSGQLIVERITEYRFKNDHYDLREVFRPVVMEFVNHIIAEGKKEVADIK